MKKKLIVLSLVLLLTLALASPVLAHGASPCADSDGDGAASGQEYAAHHVSFLAEQGMLGAGGHVPGTHHGFALCLGH